MQEGLSSIIITDTRRPLSHQSRKGRHLAHLEPRSIALPAICASIVVSPAIMLNSAPSQGGIQFRPGRILGRLIVLMLKKYLRESL